MGAYWEGQDRALTPLKLYVWAPMYKYIYILIIMIIDLINLI